MRYPLGQPVRLSTTVRDVPGALADPGALTLSIKDPNQVTTVKHWPAPPEIIRDSLGAFHFDVAGLVDVGHYTYVWAATGANAGVPGGPRSFDTYDPMGTNLVDLQDVKATIAADAGLPLDDAFDVELLEYLAATVGLVEDEIGPVLDRTVTQIVNLDRGRALLLDRVPVQSVTSLVSIRDASVYDVTGLYVDNALAGIVRRKDGNRIVGYGPHTAIYVAGRGAEVPATVNRAVRTTVQHLWETQHSPALRPSEVGTENFAPFLGAFALPNRAREMLRPYALPPSTA